MFFFQIQTTEMTFQMTEIGIYFYLCHFNKQIFKIIFFSFSKPKSVLFKLCTNFNFCFASFFNYLAFAKICSSVFMMVVSLDSGVGTWSQEVMLSKTTLAFRYNVSLACKIPFLSVITSQSYPFFPHNVSSMGTIFQQLLTQSWSLRPFPTMPGPLPVSQRMWFSWRTQCRCLESGSLYFGSSMLWNGSLGHPGRCCSPSLLWTPLVSCRQGQRSIFRSLALQIKMHWAIYIWTCEGRPRGAETQQIKNTEIQFCFYFPTVRFIPIFEAKFNIFFFTKFEWGMNFLQEVFNFRSWKKGISHSKFVKKNLHFQLKHYNKNNFWKI